MKRLSDTVHDTPCGYCDRKELNLIHTSIGKRVNALVQCQNCGRKDGMFWRIDELADVEEFEDAPADETTEPAKG